MCEAGGYYYPRRALRAAETPDAANRVGLWEISEQAQSAQRAVSVCAAQRGRDAYGTATRISTSLSRRLSAFFGSTPDQGPKAAKFAVLPPGHAGFPKRVKRSEGSDSSPVRKVPVSACGPLCAIFLRKPSVYPLSPVKANVGRLCEKLKSAMRSGLR